MKRRNVLAGAGIAVGGFIVWNSNGDDSSDDESLSQNDNTESDYESDKPIDYNFDLDSLRDCEIWGQAWIRVELEEVDEGVEVTLENTRSDRAVNVEQLTLGDSSPYGRESITCSCDTIQIPPGETETVVMEPGFSTINSVIVKEGGNLQRQCQ